MGRGYDLRSLAGSHPQNQLFGLRGRVKFFFHFACVLKANCSWLVKTATFAFVRSGGFGRLRRMYRRQSRAWSSNLATDAKYSDVVSAHEKILREDYEARFILATHFDRY